MSSGVTKVDAAPAEVTIDFAPRSHPRIRPVIEATRLHALEDLVELGVAHEERIVLDVELRVGFEDSERDLVRRLDFEERPERDGPALP